MDIKKLLKKIDVKATTWREDGGRIEVCLYYPNGQLYIKGELKDGVVDGEYEEYYEHGGLKSRGTFKNGEKVGIWTDVRYE